MTKRRLPTLQLPPISCVTGCTECCGIVPATRGEIQAIRNYVARHGVQPVSQGVTCPFAQHGRCAIYPVRPRICQAFGHSDELTCPHGRNANVEPSALRSWVLAPGMPHATLHHAFLGETHG